MATETPGAAWMQSSIAGDPGAYRYLHQSMRSFLTNEQLSRKLRENGFVDVTSRQLALGLAVLVKAARD